MQNTTPLTHDGIMRRCGRLPDWKTVCIERTGGTYDDLEVALAWAEDDEMAEERNTLHGKALQIYQILTSDEQEWGEA